MSMFRIKNLLTMAALALCLVGVGSSLAAAEDTGDQGTEVAQGPDALMPEAFAPYTITSQSGTFVSSLGCTPQGPVNPGFVIKAQFDMAKKTKTKNFKVSYQEITDNFSAMGIKCNGGALTGTFKIYAKSCDQVPNPKVCPGNAIGDFNKTSGSSIAKWDIQALAHLNVGDGADCLFKDVVNFALTTDKRGGVKFKKSGTGYRGAWSANNFPVKPSKALNPADQPICDSLNIVIGANKNGKTPSFVNFVYDALIMPTK